LRRILAPVRADLEQVEAEIRAQAAQFDPALEDHVAYAIESSGKRLRPAMAVLSGGLTGGVTAEHRRLAVTVELIHAATLVHDDILDHADVRRGQPTPNARWGNSVAVLLGDCLFAHSLRLAASFDDIRICRRIAQASSEVCTGEIVQTQRRFDFALSVPDYYRIIGMKTGALFAIAAELGAALNGASPEVCSAMNAFGMQIGTAYQVYDDCIDLAGDEQRIGKTLGSDLRRGKLTLPILHLLGTASLADKARMTAQILSGDEQGVRALVGRAIEAGAVRYAVERGCAMLDDAKAQLEAVPVSAAVSGAYRGAMEDLCVTLRGLIAPLGNTVA
jgi:octaprenyl-diphosphate synthase